MRFNKRAAFCVYDRLVLMDKSNARQQQYTSVLHRAFLLWFFSSLPYDHPLPILLPNAPPMVASNTPRTFSSKTLNRMKAMVKSNELANPFPDSESAMMAMVRMSASITRVAPANPVTKPALAPALSSRCAVRKPATTPTQGREPALV